MRRVVVTGLGMVTPLACGVEETWSRLLAGESGARRIEKFEVSDLPAKIACQIPRGDGSDGTYNPDDWMEPKEQRKVDEFIIYAMCAATQAIDDSGWKPDDLRGPDPHRRDDRLRHRRPRGHRRDRDHAQGEGAAAGVAVLHSGPADQSRVRLCVDRARAQGAEPRGGHRLLDRRACDRRRGAADRARRCRRDGRRRHRVADRAHLDRRVRGLPRAVDRLQRRADARLAPLRQGPRRLRDGRGRRRGGARGVRARQARAARGSMPR